VFEISKTKIGLTDLLKISGRIDSINAETIHETLNNEISYDDPNLVLDLETVDYMSAAGLRILKGLKEKSGHVRIANPSKRVREVLQITGLDAIYEVYDSRMEAVHAVQPVTNAHTHLEASALADKCPSVTGRDFVDWIINGVDKGIEELGSTAPRIFAEAVAKSIQDLIDAGVTMVGDVTNTGASIEPLLKSGLHGMVYVEYIGTDPSQASAKLHKVSNMIEKHRHHIQRGMHIGISIHAPYSVHPELWKLGLDYAKEHNLPLCIHVAESPAEHEYMTKGTGTIATNYYGDAPKVPPPMKSPIKFLADIGALDQRPLLVHCVHVDDEDIKLIKDSGSAVVHCPRSNLRLNCGRMPLEKFLTQDIPVLLGTDSLASSPSLSIFDEIEVAVALHHGKVEAQAILDLASNIIPVDSSVKS
jgi:aminodeoxyfutalosine deaminase